MPIPTFDQFIAPLLHVLATSPQGLRASEAQDAVAARMGITDADRQELLPSGGQPTWKNRVGWAHDRLKRAGLSTSEKRGFWRITEEGLAQARGPLPADLVARIARAGHDDDVPPVAPEAAPPATLTPDDRLEEAVRELRAVARDRLREELARVAPSHFEDVVLDVLHALGYGTSRADLQRVGRTGDGGIDGVIALDRLGLDKVYVQAKRWQANVGRPEVQSFYGALAGQRARRGVIITTSGFTRQALDFAEQVEGVVLVDGERLADLMIDHEIGVTARLVRVPKIDADYFER